MSKLYIVILFLVLGSASLAFGQSGNGISGHDVPTGQGPTEEEASPYIPNAFTPNYDGVNDEFYITNADFPKFSFSVFDRWGNRVYTSTDPNFRWNGEHNGEAVASGTYVYVMEGVSSRGRQIKRSGSISIVR